jgi:hypothetical protein
MNKFIVYIKDWIVTNPYFTLGFLMGTIIGTFMVFRVFYYWFYYTIAVTLIIGKMIHLLSQPDG